jgi:tetratricopeptide (TPR) repeat protein
MSDSSATVAQALALQQQGRLAEAAAVCLEVLAREPRNSDAMHLLGLAAATAGDVRQALALLAAAVQIQPGNAAMHANLGSALAQAGRHLEAVGCYDRALALQPQLGIAHRGRGTALMHVGRLAEAEASFLQALRLAPEDDRAHNGLAVTLVRAGRTAEARQHLERAGKLNPSNIDAHHNLALLETAAGRHREALASIERALALQPQNPALHTQRGVELLALAQPLEAIASFERALALRPQEAPAHHNLGVALIGLARHEEALASLERALELAPRSPATHLLRGKTCLTLGRPAEALASLDRARELAPQEFDAHFDRGVALTRVRRNEEALASFDLALTLDPKSHEAANNRGAVLVRMFRPAEALGDFARAVALKPDYIEAHTNAGIALRGLARDEEALVSLDRALALRPEDPSATWCKALLKLGAGDFREGWPLYEARLQREPLRGRLRSFEQPRWSGDAPIAGQRLFVYAEQGLGDTLQFCRYIPELEKMGAQVIFEVQTVLRPLLGSLAIRGTLIGRGEPVPEFDLHIPLGSLPLALGTELRTIPGEVPYLHVEPEPLREGSRRLASLAGLKVGLNWQGNLQSEQLAALEARSYPLAAAAPLARVEGISLVSLQKGAGSEQRAAVEFGNGIAQLTDPQYMGPEEMASETAAMLKGLDLLITADTALAHLAGALGVRVWVVLQAVPDWRWLTERSDSPWYPTMRLFRQRAPGDWTELFERVASELRALASSAGSPRNSAS